MSDFFLLWVVLAVFGVILNVLFWGGIIFLIVKFISGGGPASREQRMGLVAKLLQARAGGGTYGNNNDGPISDSVRGMAASVRWSHFVGQFGSEVKVYSGV